MTGQRITVLQLYPNEMNIYGDRGNVLCVLRRLEWHGYEPQLVYHHPGGTFPDGVDLVIGGGGQDSGQTRVQNDLLTIGDTLHHLADDGVPMVMVCGLYQLFGHFFRTSSGTVLRGIGVFDAETYATPRRLVGNVALHTSFGEVVGYENHSGQTVLGEGTKPFGTVVKGTGNNTRDKTEGAVHTWVIGTYLHGSLLPRNPKLADALIERAVTRKFGEFRRNAIDDTIAREAHAVARRRP